MSDWHESQLVRAVLMAANGSSAPEIAEATGKEVWQVRNKLAFYGVPIMLPGSRAVAVIPLRIAGIAHDVWAREAARRGFSADALASRIAEIIAVDGLFDAVLGDHRAGA